MTKITDATIHRALLDELAAREARIAELEQKAEAMEAFIRDKTPFDARCLCCEWFSPKTEREGICLKLHECQKTGACWEWRRP